MDALAGFVVQLLNGLAGASSLFLVAAAVSGLPMLLSGVLFAGAISSADDLGAALGANLFGAMVGGLLQLLAFRFGISSLIVIAGACYLLAGLCGQKYRHVHD